MIRNIFEILTFSKISPVTSNRLFYRSFAGTNDTLGKHYGFEFQEAKKRDSDSKIGFGRFKRNNNTGYIKSYICEFVKHDDIKKAEGFEKFDPSNTKKYWDYMEKDISATKKYRNGEEKIVKGKLVLSGYMSSKTTEMIFVEPNGKPDIFIPESILDHFEDDDQLTKWQKEFFDKEHCSGSSKRKGDGKLADNDAVVFITKESLKSEKNPQGLFFFGRARNFRLPYDLSPSEMTTNDEYNNETDMTEGLFGKIFKDDDKDSIKSRLSFGNLIINSRCEYEIKKIKLKPLSSPRPTTYQHYIVQKNEDSSQLRTYFKNHESFIRGHKLYWHRWNEEKGIKLAEGNENNNENISSTVNVVRINCSNSEHFQGVIKFSNLRVFELGALLTAIELQEGCAHKIGLGKPLGLGSVKLKIKKLILLNPELRYSSWINTSFNEINDNDRNQYKQIFGDLICNFVGDDEDRLHNQNGLNSILRLDTLFKILSWDNRPDVNKTDYLGDYKAFEKRKVLPTVYSVNDWDILEPYIIESKVLDNEPVLEDCKKKQK